MIWQGKFKMEPNCFPSLAASDMHWLHWYPLLPSTSNFLHQKLWHKYKFGCPSPNIVRALSAASKDISDISNHQKIKSSNSVHLQILQTWIKPCKLGSTLDHLGSTLDLHTFTKNWKSPPWLRFLRLFATWIVENPPPPTVELPTFQDYLASRCCRERDANETRKNYGINIIEKCHKTKRLES